MTRTSQSTTRLEVSPLESRELMSVSSLALAGGVLTVRAGNAATAVSVESNADTILIREAGSGRAWAYAAAAVREVDFIGGAGNDRFVNTVEALPTRAWGQGGRDRLEGSDASDIFFGGAGNDVLKGGGGDDNLFGGGGNDQVIGGIGADLLWGEGGNDTLIAIDDGTTDTCRDDSGRDAIWVDSVNALGDAVTGTGTGDAVQSVVGFANGADRTLDGDDIADPAASRHAYRRFSGRPLFGPGGPRGTDAEQGTLGDCWLLAGLSAIARDSPTALRQGVVAFGDGTYGVRLGDNFYRVDADLPVVSAARNKLAFADFGAGGSVWAAIVEKAYAHYRDGSADYAALDGGWPVEVNRAFGADPATSEVIDNYSSARAMANAMYRAWANNAALTVGVTQVPRRSGLIFDHAYVVLSFSRDSAGRITHVLLRNPWGWDGTYRDSNPGDGLVRVSIRKLFACVGRVEWGRV